MTAKIYVEHRNLQEFMKWANSIRLGRIVTPTVFFHHNPSKFQDPIALELSANEYLMMKDVCTEAERIKKEIGSGVEVEFAPHDTEWQLAMIRNVLKNAERHHLTAEVVNTALKTLSEIPSITPAEAIIIGEQEWIR